MPQGIILFKLIRTRDAETKERVQIVGVNLVCALEGNDRIVILVVLLVEGTHDAPSFRVVRLLLTLGLEHNDRFLCAALLDQLLRQGHPALSFHVHVLRLKGDNSFRDLWLHESFLELICHVLVEAALILVLLPHLHHLLDYLVRAQSVLTLLLIDLCVTVPQLLEILLSVLCLGLCLLHLP